MTSINTAHTRQIAGDLRKTYAGIYGMGFAVLRREGAIAYFDPADGLKRADYLEWLVDVVDGKRLLWWPR